MAQYDEAAFQRRLDLALGQVQTLLETTRHPLAPADVPHAYPDKYLLTEFLGRAAMGGVLTCLELLGLEAQQLATLREWARTRTVTLRFEAREDCSFLGEKTREVESSSQSVVEIEGPRGEQARIRNKIVTTITDYWWSFESSYRLLAFQGDAPDAGLTILERSGSIGLKTSTEKTPRPQRSVPPPIDVQITWLLGHVDAEAQLAFAIDRADERCHTPRRNPEVEAALIALVHFVQWSSAVSEYVQSELLPVQREPALDDFDRSALTVKELFSPVVPLFSGDGRGGAAEPLLPLAYVNRFLDEQRRRLEAKRARLAEAFPQDNSLITLREVLLLVTLKHARQVCRDFAAGVEYVEDMLRKQLVAAVGKVLTPVDFAEYMAFHYRKLFRPEFCPRPFSHAIRRPHHDPEGTLSLEVQRGDATPVATLVQQRPATRAMSFPLDAATQVSFLGERFLHAWIGHQFSGSREQLTLVARARQFSSFVLLVGRIASADSFAPSHAVIVQNKDVLQIPLELEQIPTPKEFRDAIESLSPEQQRFAKAFRGMQLESTLFGVCVLQIKPQLERLLKLPDDSLTKEIKLTQDLLALFMDYQIPSDLLAYEGDPEASPEEKLERVRGYVARMQGLIEEAKQKELAEAQQREAFRRAEADRSPRAGGGFDPFAPKGVAADPFGGDPFGGDPFGGAPGFAADRACESGGGAMVGGPPPPPMPCAPPPSAPPTPSAVPTASAPPQPTAQAEPARVEAPEPAQPSQPSATDGGGGGLDYTRIPALLDRRVELLDDDAALRATIINPADPWEKSFRKSLLAEVAQTTLYEDEQRSEKDKAFDLIDALSKSGDLAFEHASLHVVIASTHCFDRTLLETVVQGNVNPIERVERSSMIVATTIHDRPARELLLDDQRERFFATSPQLAAAPDARALGDGASPEG